MGCKHDEIIDQSQDRVKDGQCKMIVAITKSYFGVSLGKYPRGDHCGSRPKDYETQGQNSLILMPCTGVDQFSLDQVRLGQVCLRRDGALKVTPSIPST